MTHKYRNPWYNRSKPDHDGRFGAYNRAFFYCEYDPEIYEGFEIFHRVQNSADVFDIVQNGECIIQCAGINEARRKVNEIIKERRKDRLEACTLHKYANGAGGFSYVWADENLKAVGIEPSAEEIADYEKRGGNLQK